MVDYSAANMGLFLLITFLFLIVLKPRPTVTEIVEYDKNSNGEQVIYGDGQKQYSQFGNMYLVIYFLIVVITQILFNLLTVYLNCQGKLTDNLKTIPFYTIIPWCGFFGVVIIIIKFFPGLKNVFSDVIGYFVVSLSANKIIIDLLKNDNVKEIGNNNSDRQPQQYTPQQYTPQQYTPQQYTPQQYTQEQPQQYTQEQSQEREQPREREQPPLFTRRKHRVKSLQSETSTPPSIETRKKAKEIIKEFTQEHPQEGGRGSSEDIEKYEVAADLIAKLYENPSILINTMVPGNFLKSWKLLIPLMKDKYKAQELQPKIRNDPDSEIAKIKDELFGLVVMKDNIGQAMWYMYTGIVIISFVQLNITLYGCRDPQEVLDQSTMTINNFDSKVKEKQQKLLNKYVTTPVE
jgi:hypothetical protein